MLQPIERAIIAANIGINPQNDGNIIRLFRTSVNGRTQKGGERAQGEEEEHSKVAIRNLRRDAQWSR